MNETDLLGTQQGVGAATPSAPASAPEDWKTQLPEDIRNDPSLNPIKDLNGLAKSYVNAQKLIGRDKIPMPKDENDPLWDDVYNRLGRPETPDKYEFNKPDLPGYDEATDKAFREQAHKLGLSKRQAGELYGWYNQLVLGKVADAESQTAGIISSLQNELGDKFQETASRATSAVKYFGGDELVQYLNTSTNAQGVPIGNDPVLFKFFAKLGESLGEDKLKGTLGLGVAPQEAQDKITGILADKNHAYHNRFAAGHEEAVATVRKLFEAAYPGESK